MGRSAHQGAHAGGEDPVGLRLRHSLYRGQTGADTEKSRGGFYNLKRTDLTFEALTEVWLHSQRNAVKESTYAHYSYTLHKYLLPVLSKVPVASLDESFLEQAMQQIIAPTDAAHKPLGNSSARECLLMLRRICKYAAHLRLIRPMELKVALPKAIDKISAPLSPAEQQQLYRYVQENPTPRKIGLLLGLELGLRIGEICGLQWGDFDLKLGTLKINRTVCRIFCGNVHTKVVIQMPKTRTSRREIPTTKQLLIMLKKLRGNTSNSTWFLSGNESKSYTDTAYHNEELKSLTRYRFEKVRERAKLKQSVSRLVTILFPELEKLAPSLHIASVYALLREYPGAKQISEVHLTKLTSLLATASKGHYGKEKAIQIRATARTSIGSVMPAKSLE